jgi:N-dimethylarginine dimethylaminohydrolase
MSTQSLDLAATQPFLNTFPPRQTFLMCAPTLYDVDYVINPWMAGNLHASSRERAAIQWKQLYDAVATVAEVVLIEPQPGSPDMVFTANAGLERDGTVILSSFFHSERQDEEDHFRGWFQRAGYDVRALPRETPFEGEGDALFSADGTRLWAANGPRSVAAAHPSLAAAWDLEVISLDLIDPRFYHLDTCFAPLSDDSVLYYPGAFSEESLRRIEAFYPEGSRIAATEADAARFACNAVNIDRTIILNCISDNLRDRLRSRGFDVVQVDLTEFLKAGGAAKCLVMKLSGTPTL